MMNIGSKIFGLATAAAISLCAAGALAGDTALAQPEGPVLLTVSGEIGATNVDGTAQFDLQMLEALGVAEISTSTIWTEGVQEFRGTPLAALTEALGITEGAIKATAVNDYAVEIPLSDAVENGALIAFARNGDLMSVRDKGPLWVIYPYDQNPDYQSEVFYSRSIWQLDRIEFTR